MRKKLVYPKTPKTKKSVNIRIDSDVIERVKIQIEKRNLKLTDIVKIGLIEFLKETEKEN